MKLPKLIYLANAYSSKLEDPDCASLQRHNRRTLEAFIAGKLKKKYNVTVLAPIALSAAIADVCNIGTTFNDWMKDDFNFISRSDEVWVLVSDGWKTSDGVQQEIRFAKANLVPVRYLSPVTLEFLPEETYNSLYTEKTQKVK